MKTKNISRSVGIAALAAGLVLAPTVANAVPSYAPVDSSVVAVPAPSYAPGGTVTLTWGPGAFSPNQAVSFTMVGNFAQQGSFAVIRSAPQTLAHSKNAAGDGSLSINYTLPANASGTYTMTAASGDWSRSWTFTVDAAGTGSTTASVGNQLAETGSNDSSLLLWAVGGGIALVAGGIVVTNSLRKDKKLAS